MFKLRTGMIWFYQHNTKSWSLADSVEEQEMKMDLCGI